MHRHLLRRVARRRCLSDGAVKSLAPLDMSALTIVPTTTPRPRLPNDQLVFGRIFSDHMLVADWNQETGWQAPEIKAYGPLSLLPAASVLHYALECFEGMKAYVDQDSKIRLFRPEMNMKRLQRSAERLCFPQPDPEVALELIKQLVRLDRDWIPKEFGYSLYIRPTMISTYPYLGVSPSGEVKFFTITCPVGPYYATGFKPVSLLADKINVRAWPGGSGDCKLGANYAPGIFAQQKAAQQGFNQILWLFGDDYQVTEVGTMNQFFLWKTRSGEIELVTAPLDGTILPGVTRDSVIALCKKWGEFKVSERKYTITDVVDAVKERRMIEAFGSGTAAIVSPVKNIHYDGVDYAIPLDLKDRHALAGPLTTRILKTIQDIQYGKLEHEWSVCID